MNNRQGFTLIEMLVVVAIIGLLSSVVVVGLSGARQKARDAKRLADVQQIMNSAEVQFTNMGYPGSPGNSATIKMPKGPQNEDYFYSGGTTSSAAMACMETLENGSEAVLSGACASAFAGTVCPAGRPNYFCKTSAQ